MEVIKQKNAGVVGDTSLRTWLWGGALALMAVLAIQCYQAYPRADARMVRRAATEQYRSDMAAYRARNRLDTDKDLLRRLRRVTARIRQAAFRRYPEAAGFRWEAHVVLDSDQNAFSYAEGKMGLADQYARSLHMTDAELASVVGHEAGHMLLHHMERKAATRAKIAYWGAVAQLVTGIPLAGGAVMWAARYAVVLPRSREMELEADRLGLRLMTEAGYNPCAGLSLRLKLAAAAPDGRFDWFTSGHPTNAARVAQMKALLGARRCGSAAQSPWTAVSAAQSPWTAVGATQSPRAPRVAAPDPWTPLDGAHASQ